MKNRIPVSAPLALFALLVFAPAAPAAAAEPPPAALPVAATLSSRPSEAALEVDGIPAGTTPATLALAPGRHVARLAPDGAPATFAEFDVSADRPDVRFDLPAPSVPVLLDSEPRGASVSRDGFDVGATPLLLPEVPAGRHVFAFKLAGHRDHVAELDLTPPAPVRLAPALVPVSGSLDVKASPDGALVIVGGMPRGAAPILVENLPEGEVDVRIEAPGHRPFAGRAAISPGKTFALSAALEPLPGSIRVVTVPSGATVYVDDRRIGVSPVTAIDLPAGPHRVRVLHDGCDPAARTVQLALAEERTESFTLAADAGSIRVATAPAGVEVLVDGERCGVTKPAPGAAAGAPSAPLEIPGIRSGARKVEFVRAGYAPAVRTVSVERGATADVPAVALEKLFAPDFLVETSVRVYRGVFVEKTKEAYRLEIEPGVFRTFPFKDVVRAEILDDSVLDRLLPPPGK
ncbi:MAG: PEGA domain-containing protein [Kiritimatiellae bacterium]|nr:PEGA domain-containing protein [Kiritimatiellia bacterium]